MSGEKFGNYDDLLAVGSKLETIGNKLDRAYRDNIIVTRVTMPTVAAGTSHVVPVPGLTANHVVYVSVEDPLATSADASDIKSLSPAADALTITWSASRTPTAVKLMILAVLPPHPLFLVGRSNAAAPYAEIATGANSDIGVPGLLTSDVCLPCIRTVGTAVFMYTPTAFNGQAAGNARAVHGSVDRTGLVIDALCAHPMNLPYLKSMVYTIQESGAGTTINVPIAGIDSTWLAFVFVHTDCTATGLFAAITKVAPTTDKVVVTTSSLDPAAGKLSVICVKPLT